MRRILSILCLLGAASAASGQVLTNANLTGKYFLRHVEFTTDLSDNPTDERSIVGAATFDGKGGYSFTGQQAVGAGAAAPYSVTGTYAMKDDGSLTMTNPQKTATTLYARYGVEAVVGTSTEAPDNTFDLLIAIPAPASSAVYSNATLSVSYNLADLELVVNTATPQLRSSIGIIQFDGAGTASLNSATGHTTAVNGGVAFKQTPTGSYSLAADGTGGLTLQLPSGATSDTALFGNAQRTLMVSQSGNIVMASTPGGHDVLIGLRAAATDNLILPGAFSGRYWYAGMSITTGSSGSIDNTLGALSVISADSNAVISQREHQSASPSHFSSTSANGFVVNKNALNAGAATLLPGRGGNMIIVNAGGNSTQADNTGYSLALALQIPGLSGTGVFLNPQGIVNAASNAPVGSQISPGEFITLYGTGLSPQTLVSAPPYPSQVGGVGVTIGGLAAPVYLVSAGQINCLVPYGISTASGTTTVVVSNNGTNSNTVTVPVGATAPGIFSNDLTGTGDGAIVHQSGALVNAATPALPGETLTIYLTGLGALQTPVTDGAAPTPPAADSAKTTISVSIGGVPSPKISYSGINPVYPGLYQINFQMPILPGQHGEQNVLIVTSDFASQQINLFVQ